MKKRSNLAGKLHIVIVAMAVMITAFFHVPMDAHAEVKTTSIISSPQISNVGTMFSGISPLSASPSTSAGNRYICENKITYDSNKFDFSPYLTSGDGLYKVTFDITPTYKVNTNACYWVNVFTCINVSGSFYQRGGNSGGKMADFSYTGKDTVVYIDTANSAVASVGYASTAIWIVSEKPSVTSVTFTMSYQISNVVAEKLTIEDNNSYQNGYDSGYQAGVESVDTQSYYDTGYQAGAESVDTQSYYDSGYQAGAESVDTQSYYDSGFQAGKDSIDTQSYYDSGYQAGYDIGFAEGVDSMKLPDVNVNTGGINSILDRLDKLGDVVSSLTDNMTGKKKKK